MWVEARRNHLIEPRLIGAVVGAILVLGAVSLVTLGIQRWQWFDRPSELDQVVPAEAETYLRLDLRRNSLSWWNTASVRERWIPLLADIEKDAQRQLADGAPLTELWSEVAGEIAYVQYDNSDPDSQAILVRTQSAEHFAEKLAQNIPAQSRAGVWQSQQPSELFVWLNQWLGGEAMEPATLYWQPVTKRVLLISLQPDLKQRLAVASDRKTETMRDRLDPYQPGKGILHGFLPLARVLPAAGAQLIAERVNRSEESAAFIELKTDGTSLVGRIQDRPQSLLTRLTLGDASGKYSESLVAFPRSVTAALVDIVPQKLQQSAAGFLTGTDEQLDWSAFVQREFGLDWEENVLPILDLPTDIIVGEPTETQPQPFLIVLQAENPATAELRFNNIEAMFRQVAARLFPREVEKVLPDGTVGVELLPDPQTPRLTKWAGNQAEEAFLDLPISDTASLVFGQLKDRILITNSAELLRSAISGEGSRLAELNPACVSDLRGQEVYVFTPFTETSESLFSRFFSHVWLGSSADENQVALTFCLPFTQ